MTLANTLRKARELLAGGWTEPLCQDAEGRWCSAQDEGVVSLNVLEALEAAGREHVTEAWELLEQIALPATAAYNGAGDQLLKTNAAEDLELLVMSARLALGEGLHLDAWLQHPTRKLAHVLRLFDLAILRAGARATSSTTEGIHP
jgi:hypothetical protein